MTSIFKRGTLGLLLGVALSASAEIYTYVDDNGNRAYTDRPGGRAVETVKSAPANTMPATPPAARVRPSSPSAPVQASAYQQVLIVTPVPDATLRNNAGELMVSARVEPALRPGHQLRLYLDDEPILGDGQTLTFALHNIDRGTHQLALGIIDADGQVMQRTPNQTFHMIRTSLAQRRMVKPCKKDDYGQRPECPLKDKPQEKRDIPFVPFI